MTDVAQQITDMKANSVAFASVTIRGVIGGYVVSGNAQYQDRVTKGVVLSENAEGIAGTATGAVNMAGNFLVYGTFDSPQTALAV